MVEAKISYIFDDLHFRLEVDGHAGQAKSGKDIVCSAVSTLTYSAAQVVQVMAANGYCSNTPTVDLESGKAVIDLVCESEEEYNRMRLTTLFLVAGFALLQKQYPKYVKFIIDEA